MAEKMKVEIWSDVMCPFCYIGKRKFERALADLPFRDQVEVIWKSYQLDPNLTTDVAVNYYDNLANKKGMPSEQAKAMCSQVADMAKTAGLHFQFDRAVVANTFRAHELLHFAKRYGKQDQAEELLFQAHFTDGENVDELSVLSSIAATLGLDTIAFEHALHNRVFEDAVRQDMYEAQQIGVRGVPFFVYDQKYAISGAQDISVFTETIKKSFAEWSDKNNGKLQVIEGSSCGPDGC